MVAFIVIVIIVVIIIVAVNMGKSGESDAGKSIKVHDIPSNDKIVNDIIKKTMTESLSGNQAVPKIDDSIIDVTGQTEQLQSTVRPATLTKYNEGVPYWNHQYVYSYNEINGASSVQVNFYNQLKYRFLKGEYLDVEGNSNYVFILLFDLLNEYDKHRNSILVERQMMELSKHYPKTAVYTKSFLIKKLQAAGDEQALLRIQSNQDQFYPQQYSSGYTFQGDYWGIGTKYKDKLKLKDDEVKILNKLSYYGNSFCDIEFCFIEIIRLYLSVLEELNASCVIEGSTFEKETAVVADVILQKHFMYKYGSSNYTYGMDSVTRDIYSNIFKYCENAVRETYGHKRKINTDTFYTNEAKLTFETKVITPLIPLLKTLISIISQPDKSTDIELYAKNTNRWKIKFEELTINYKQGDSKEFIKAVIELGKLNEKNPSVENIFFEASKFIAKLDKEASLSLYIYYLHFDLKSANFDNKQLTKTIQKSLFANNEQLHDFEIIISELVTDKDLKKALEAVSKLYIPKRKKIQLDIKSIQEVQQQHSGTVELLNEYLNDEYEDETNTIKSQEINNEELKIEIIQKAEVSQNSTYCFSFTQVQTEVLDMFAKSSFTVEQIEFDNFAKSRGAFKNQLIESINEICYENLDDVLIEEENEYYTINENYYQQLLAK